MSSGPQRCHSCKRFRFDLEEKPNPNFDDIYDDREILLTCQACLHPTRKKSVQDQLQTIEELLAYCIEELKDLREELSQVKAEQEEQEESLQTEKRKRKEKLKLSVDQVNRVEDRLAKIEAFVEDQVSGTFERDKQ